MRIRLQVYLTPGAAFVFEHGGPSVRIGRDPGCELSLQGESVQPVSWEHARIDLSARGATLTDLGSTNGTYLNAAKVQPRTILRVGDEVRFGKTGPSLQVASLELAEPARLPARRVSTGREPPPLPAYPPTAPAPEFVAASTRPIFIRWQWIAVAFGGVILALLLVIGSLSWRLRRSASEPTAPSEMTERPTPPPQPSPKPAEPTKPPEPRAPEIDKPVQPPRETPPPGIGPVLEKPRDEMGIATVPGRKSAPEPTKPEQKPPAKKPAKPAVDDPSP